MNLQAFLMSRAMPAREFSRRIGVSPAAVARYASGKRIPSPDVMQRIIAETEGAVTPNDFYDVPLPPSDTEARTNITVEIAADLLDEAERLGTDLVAVAERALTTAIRDARRTQWRQENAGAITEANEELARNGLWSDGLRLF